MMKQCQKRYSSIKRGRPGVRSFTIAGRRECGTNYARGLVPLLGVPAWVYLSRLMRTAPKPPITTTQARVVIRVAAT